MSTDRNPDRVFFELEPEFRHPSESAAAILPVPYDRTSSWKKGADRGPEAILEASAYVEPWDLETGTEPFRRGIATLAPLLWDGEPETLADLVAERTAEILGRGQLPVVLGGEHSVTIGAVRAAVDRVPTLSVLQIDAHGDTRERYHGSEFNHGCVMARVREWCPIVQVGIRSIDTSEVAKFDSKRVFLADEIVRAKDRSWVERVVELLTDDVYVTIDMDAFDPSIVPATGTPEPGGLDWYQVTDLLAAVAREKTVHAFDVVELCPAPGQHASAFTAAKLIHRFLAMILAKRPS